ncbi:DUF1476 domain-containing protein [Algisphaera agarilytica]|uniref:DUF1476 domain-containing protein n=1 Tax=Algisphaera agarilytica TaxID=1385975 RepID=A0A7X0LK65_9BACT|nr:DUF1476 domain-containing protein [Algisphaera agarilytica]MBB6430110.1 hypothetical protein [Algisphaera agarilytica]
MSGYEERKRGMETQLAHDSELNFKVRNRRNRLLGEWAAFQLGLEGKDAMAYAQDVVHADFSEPGEDDVARKVMDDFKTYGVAVTPASLRHRMAMLMGQAERQVHDEV